MQSIEWALQELKDLHGQNSSLGAVETVSWSALQKSERHAAYRNVPDQRRQLHFYHELMRLDQEYITADLDQPTARARAENAKINARNRKFWEQQSSAQEPAVAAAGPRPKKS